MGRVETAGGVSPNTDDHADDEEVSEGGIPWVIVLGYDGLPLQPVAPPSSDYIPGPENPQTPPVPQDEDEREPILLSRDPRKDPEEYEDDETEDVDEDEDEVDGGYEEEEEHIAPTDSTIVAPIDEPTPSTIHIPLPPEAEVESVLSSIETGSQGLIASTEDALDSRRPHQELQTHRDHVYAHETYLQAHQTQLQLQSTLIQTQHQVHETRFQMQQAELAALRETDRRRQDQMTELLATGRVKQRPELEKPGPEARITDLQDCFWDVDSHNLVI
ncbi:hypothetical protein Tco_0348051 [Tanacetum coccineum]